ncbi:hypothetical protein SKAU_G00122230 [Synaphobranchus kaupii]|uniref:Telomerase RNA component interacting RNase n=1 Tax=Synaphobranchus kaupii TaxID=118154 RepID=A0A9Q1J0D7_SYNKA|nr:hypothetical protein SKAU_G00122230 [Synaphobranchus kaupii]
MVQTENMDSKRRSSKTRGSESNGNSTSTQSPGSPRPGIGNANRGNAFANDGSFLDMFKKKMEEEKRKKEMEQGQSDKGSAEGEQSTQEKKTCGVASFVGKRRGGAKLALKTGMVAKKQKLETEIEPGKGDAWTKYMTEVRKYKAHQCGDDDKTRPLVK